MSWARRSLPDSVAEGIVAGGSPGVEAHLAPRLSTGLEALRRNGLPPKPGSTEEVRLRDTCFGDTRQLPQLTTYYESRSKEAYHVAGST
jgi:hypothetical protein